MSDADRVKRLYNSLVHMTIRGGMNIPVETRKDLEDLSFSHGVAVCEVVRAKKCLEKTAAIVEAETIEDLKMVMIQIVADTL